MSRPRFIALLLVLGTLAVYLPACRFTFVNFDDDDYVSSNVMVQNGLTWAGAEWAFTTWHASNWHPFTWLSLMADCQLFGPNAGALHGVNILFHAANAVLLFALLWRLTRSLWPSAFVAALFAWHPLHVESVAWIAERKDVLSTFFALLTLLAYSKTVTDDKCRAIEIASGKHFPPASYFGALFLFMCGLLAKPMLVTLPFVMLLLDYWPLRRLSASTVRGVILEKWPYFLLAAVSCAVTFLAQHHGGVMMTLQQFSPAVRVGNALLSFACYFGQAFWPVKLSIFYPFSIPLPAAKVAASAIILAVLTLAIVRVQRRCPYLLMGWLWFLGTLVPVIGLVQVGAQAHADRYTYLPFVGIFIALTFAAADWAVRFRFEKVVAVAGVLAAAACAALASGQLQCWRDSVSLYRHAVAVTQNNAAAHYCLGLALAQQGQREEALAEYRAAEKLEPDRFETHRNIAGLLDEMGKPEEALAESREALRLQPNSAPLRLNVASLLGELGRFEEAEAECKQAAQSAPSDPRPHCLLARTRLRQGRDAAAVAELREALRVGPDDFESLLLLAQTLAANSSPAIRDGAEAVKLAARASDLAGGRQPFALDVLAMAYAEAGRFKDAEETEQRAIHAASEAGLTETNKMNERLALFQSRQPYRESFSAAPAKF